MSLEKAGYLLVQVVLAAALAVAVLSVVRLALLNPPKKMADGSSDPAHPVRASATASWLLTVCGMGLGVVAPAPLRFTTSLAGCALMLVAIGAGLFALTRVRRFGRPGIMTPATIGLGLNLLLIATAFIEFFHRR